MPASECTVSHSPVWRRIRCPSRTVSFLPSHFCRLISAVSFLPSHFCRLAVPLRQAKPLAALVLLCFCLFAFPNSPNLAQGGYPGGGGYPGAAGWILDHYSVSGTRTWPAPQPNETLPNYWTSPVYAHYGSNLTASITAHFVWHGPGQPTTPVWARITAHADGSNLDGSPDSADDGFGDPSPGNSSGVHWVRKAVPVGATTLEIGPYTLHGSGSSLCPTIEFGVGISDHVIITSPDIETSYYKSTAPPEGQVGPGPLVRAEHKRNPDGSIETDSAVAWDSYSGVWRGGGSFRATSPFSDPLFTWNLSGDGNPSVYNENNELGVTAAYLQTIGLDLGFGSHVSGFPKQSTVSATVKSQSDASVTDFNDFTIKWHLPYEPTYLRDSGRGKYIHDTRMSGLWPDQTGILHESREGEKPADLLIDGAQAVAGFTGHEEIAGLLELVGSATHIVNYLYPYPHEPEVDHGATNNASSWGTAKDLSTIAFDPGNLYNVPLDLYSNPDGWRQCTMSWCRVAYYKDETWDTDKYDTHGYVSSGWTLYGRDVTAMRDEPVFYKDYTYPGGGGSGGGGEGGLQ